MVETVSDQGRHFSFRCKWRTETALQASALSWMFNSMSPGMSSRPGRVLGETTGRRVSVPWLRHSKPGLRLGGRTFCLDRCNRPRSIFPRMPLSMKPKTRSPSRVLAWRVRRIGRHQQIKPGQGWHPVPGSARALSFCGGGSSPQQMMGRWGAAATPRQGPRQHKHPSGAPDFGSFGDRLPNH